MAKPPKDPPQRESEKTIDLKDKQEIGSLAYWSVSSHKPGYGVDNLRDLSLESTWQSEGPQPHLINIVFPRRVSIVQLSMYINVTSDDSYTPQKLSIRAGNSISDLSEVQAVELNKPKGWQHFHLVHGQIGLGNDQEDKEKCKDVARVTILQIAVLSNHLNGKDTHIRSIRIFSPLATPEHSFLSGPTNPLTPIYAVVPTIFDKASDMFERRDMMQVALEQRKAEILKVRGRAFTSEETGLNDDSMLTEFVSEMPKFVESLKEYKDRDLTIR